MNYYGYRIIEFIICTTILIYWNIKNKYEWPDLITKPYTMKIFHSKLGNDNMFNRLDIMSAKDMLR